MLAVTQASGSWAPSCPRMDLLWKTAVPSVGAARRRQERWEGLSTPVPSGPGLGGAPATCAPCSAKPLTPASVGLAVAAVGPGSGPLGQQKRLQKPTSLPWSAEVSGDLPSTTGGDGLGVGRGCAVGHRCRDLQVLFSAQPAVPLGGVASGVPSGLCFELRLKALRLCPPSLLALAPHSLFSGEAGVRPSAACSVAFPEHGEEVLGDFS